MKSIRMTLPLILMFLSVPAYPQSDAQKSFDKLKTLSGAWEGKVTTDMKVADLETTPMHVVLRTTSRGNALMHEMTSAGSPDDPITMFYLDDNRVLLTHYCDAGNRPRMEGKLSPDGKTVELPSSMSPAIICTSTCIMRSSHLSMRITILKTGPS